MKKFWICAAVWLTALLCLTACAQEEPNDVNIAETFKLRAWVLNEDLEGDGYLTYEDTGKIFCQGRWVSYDDREREWDIEEVFRYEEIEPGVERTLAPMGYYLDQNINLDFEFDGTIEVATDPAEDDTVQLAYSMVNPDSPQCGNWITINPIEPQTAPMTVNVCPIGLEMNNRDYILRDTLQFREYTLLVTARMHNGMEVLTARIELKALNDRFYPWDKIPNGSIASQEPRTRFLSIEIAEIAHSENYLLTYGN